MKLEQEQHFDELLKSAAKAENAALPRPKDKETMAIRTMSTPFFKM